MNLRRPRPHVIRNRQRAAPLLRRHRARQRGQQRLRVAIRNRQHRNFRDALRLLQRQTLGIGSRADPRRQRIPRARGSKIHDAAALHSIRIAHRPQRKHIVARVSVILRFRVDEAANGSVLGCNLRLHPAPTVIVLGDYNRAFHRNAKPVELLVVLGQAVVHKHQRPGNIAVNRVGVIRGQLFRLLIRSWIHRQRRLFELGRELRGRKHFQHAHLGRRKQNVEPFDVRVQSPFLEVGKNPFGVVLIVGRPHMMRPRAQPPHVFTQVCRVGDGAKLRLPFALALTGAWRVPHQRSLI